MTHILLLAALLVSQQSTAAQSGEFAIRVGGQPSPDLQRGIELGLAEMQRTAALVRRSIVLAHDSSASAAAIIVATTDAPVPAGDAVVRIHIGPLPSGAEACEFSVAPPDPPSDQKLVVWDASLSQFGASELNERYNRTHRSGMTEAAYLGWVAVKAVVEAELRRKPDQEFCSAIATLKFDGHKGRPLFFDPKTRTLSQPLYIVKDGKIVGTMRDGMVDGEW